MGVSVGNARIWPYKCMPILLAVVIIILYLYTSGNTHTHAHTRMHAHTHTHTHIVITWRRGGLSDLTMATSAEAHKCTGAVT